MNEIQYLRPKLTSLKYFRTCYMVKKAKKCQKTLTKTCVFSEGGISDDQNTIFLSTPAKAAVVRTPFGIRLGT